MALSRESGECAAWYVLIQSDNRTGLVYKCVCLCHVSPFVCLSESMQCVKSVSHLSRRSTVSLLYNHKQSHNETRML